jgi:hypothetical protein
MGLRGTQMLGSIIYTLVSSPRDSTRIADLGFNLRSSNLRLDQYLISSDLQIFDLVFRLIFYYNVLQGVLMNKPDNSDGSRGQLTTRTDTCHLLQIQSPWTWIRETGQTHSFAAFRTYKGWIPLVLRVPSVSTRIFIRVVDTDKYKQSASICVYWATQDGSQGLTFTIYFNQGIQVLSWWCNSRIICRSLVWLFQCSKYSGYSTLINKKLLPMGVMMLPKASFAFLAPLFMTKHHRVRAQRSWWE